MRSKRVADIEDFKDPQSASWSAVEAQSVAMKPTPMAMQPTGYIRNSRADMPHGQVSELQVACVHDGETLAIRLSWEGVSDQERDFPDAAAVAMPIKGNPVLALMGSKKDPIHILQWKANKGVRSMMASGIGLSGKGPELPVSSQAASEGNRWNLVITRKLGEGENIAPLKPGQDSKVGFAIWYGNNDERAGLKAFSVDWAPLSVDA